MKTISTILLLFLLHLGAAGQFKKLQLTIDILPELKAVLENQQAELVVLQDSNIHAKAKIPGTIILNHITSDSTVIVITWTGKVNGVDKYYRLTIDLLEVRKAAISDLHITFPEDCVYNKNSINNHCPRCGKADSVIPILYGLLVPIFDEKGKQIKEIPEHYPGGCTVTNCDPTWYCKRDMLSF